MDDPRTLLRTLVARFGRIRLLLAVFYPLTTLLTTPVRLAQAVWSARILLDGRWREYPLFEPYTAVNNLFYWSPALEIARKGRHGVSSLLGMGAFPLSSFRHYSFPSLYAFCGAGAVSVLGGFLLWLLAHVAWLGHAGPAWLGVVVLLSFVSTTFYANAFCMQNYNALGWAFFPLGVWGLMSGHWEATTAAWLLCSLGSVSLVAVAMPLSLVAAATHMSLWPLAALLPALLKVALHLMGPGGSKAFLSILASVGALKWPAKYRRRLSTSRKLHLAYFFILYAMLAGAFLLLGVGVPWYLLAGLAVFAVNGTMVRFLDHQSTYMMLMSLAAGEVLLAGEPWLLPWYWLAVSPIPLLVGFAPDMTVLDVVPRQSPFSVAPLLDAVEGLLAPVPPGTRVFMAFEDPGNDYFKVFDGYRVLMELPKYVCVRKDVHLFPDWFAVYETNFEGSPSFWGRDPGSVRENMAQWKAEFALVYQQTLPLDPCWEEGGFEVLTQLDWSMFKDDFRDMPPFARGMAYPVWWLLRRRAD